MLQRLKLLTLLALLLQKRYWYKSKASSCGPLMLQRLKVLTLLALLVQKRYWYKSKASSCGPLMLQRLKVLTLLALRYSVYLLCWYRGTNADTY
jgi:hypothetical protein